MTSNHPPPSRVETFQYLELTEPTFVEAESREVTEVLRRFELIDHFERGGFIGSLYAPSIERSENWRDSYIREALPALPPRPNGDAIDPALFWRSLANYQCEPEEALRRALQLDKVTFRLILSSLLDHELINRLEFWPEVGRKARAPLIYIRDSGLWHRFYAMIRDPTGRGSNARLEGKAWEAFNVEALRGVISSRARPFVWRRDAAGEIDLVLDWESGTRWGIEISRSPSKRPSAGFHRGCDALSCERRIVVCPTKGNTGARSVEILRLEDALMELKRGPT